MNDFSLTNDNTAVILRYIKRLSQYLADFCNPDDISITIRKQGECTHVDLFAGPDHWTGNLYFDHERRCNHDRYHY